MNEQYQYTCVIFLSLILNINVLNGTKPSIIWFMVSFTHRLWSLPLTACFYRLSRARLPLWGPGWRWRQSRYQLWPPLIVRLQFLKSKEANIHTNTANTGNIRDSKIFSHFYPPSLNNNLWSISIHCFCLLHSYHFLWKLYLFFHEISHWNLDSDYP